MTPYQCHASKPFIQRLNPIAAAVLALSSIYAPASFADFVIQSGQTVTATQVLNDNETGVIQPGGTLSPPSTSLGINAPGASVSITNSGSISTEGNFGYGIASTGTSASITNSGSISTTGTDGYGIASTGATANITNSGSISTTGTFGLGITSSGTSAIITNSGSISTTGAAAYGIYSDGTTATITNSGSISTTGNNGDGIRSFSANATITNSGSISTIGVSAYGIISEGANAIITNSGSISMTGALGRGIWSDGANATITNGGSIISTGANGSGVFLSKDGSILNNSGLIQGTGSGSFAVTGGALGTNQTLNILPGSQILGVIDLGDGAGDVVNVSGTFGSSVMQFLNTETINVLAPNAVKIGTDTVVSVEPTGESARGAMLSNMTTGLHTILGQRMQSVQPLRPTQLASLELGPGMLRQEREPYAWAQVFGSSGRTDASGQMLTQDTRMGGFMGGYERDDSTGRVGFILGASRSHADTAAQALEGTSVFGGVYRHAFLGWANLSASLIAGAESQKQGRIVLDNTLGLQTARSSTSSVFVSPSVTLSRVYALAGGNEFRPSVMVAYSFGRYKGYTETGTTSANLSVGARNVQALSTRAQLEWGFALDSGEASLRVGAQTRNTDSDTVRLNLSGTSFGFAAMGNKNAVGRMWERV